MKIKLLRFFLLLITIQGFSQTDIEQFQSASGSKYTQVTGTIDQSPMGVNTSWDFTNLTATNTVLTDAYIDTPPSSTIQTSEGGTLISKVGLITNAGELSITSALSSGIQLNYTDLALIGTFPLSFGYTNTDGVEGTFTGPASGNVLNTSTISVDVDAWGNLKVGTFDGPITRLKIIQNLNLSALGGLVNGSATQTSYFYYDANSNDLIFRSTRLEAPLANIDDTIMESLITYSLSTDRNQYADPDIKLATNPVKDVLKLIANDFVEINGLTISDVAGRVVLKADTNESSLNVSHLNPGLFWVSIITNHGVVVKKFVKQ